MLSLHHLALRVTEVQVPVVSVVLSFVLDVSTAITLLWQRRGTKGPLAASKLVCIMNNANRYLLYVMQRIC